MWTMSLLCSDGELIHSKYNKEGRERHIRWIQTDRSREKRVGGGECLFQGRRAAVVRLPQNRPAPSLKEPRGSLKGLGGLNDLDLHGDDDYLLKFTG